LTIEDMLAAQNQVPGIVAASPVAVSYTHLKFLTRRAP